MRIFEKLVDSQNSNNSSQEKCVAFYFYNLSSSGSVLSRFFMMDRRDRCPVAKDQCRHSFQSSHNHL